VSSKQNKKTQAREQTELRSKTDQASRFPSFIIILNLYYRISINFTKEGKGGSINNFFPFDKNSRFALTLD